MTGLIRHYQIAIRELPVGARQSKRNAELSLELLTEIHLWRVDSDGTSAVTRKGISDE